MTSQTRSARSKRKVVAEGAVALNVLLPADVGRKLDTLAARYGTKKAAIVAAIEALSGSNDLTQEQVLDWIKRNTR